MVGYGQLLHRVWPEIVCVLTALLVIGCDLLFFRRAAVRVRFAVAAGIGSLGCIVALIRLLEVSTQAATRGNMLVDTPLTRIVQMGLLVLTIFTLLLAVDSEFTEHVGEFVLLVLLATTGMLFLVASEDLLILFISLELLSLSLYILTGFDKAGRRSAEASLKYFLFGGMSAAFLLFGFSLLYGFSNSTTFSGIAAAVHAHPWNPILLVAIVMTVIGFGFKIAAAPFHFWAPDVYEGAPSYSAAFIASESKVASFFIFFQVMVLGFAGGEGIATLPHFVSGWVPVLVLVACASMLLGNLAAIVQSSVRRLMAYSAVAHAGYMLLAYVAHTERSLAALLYYVATYALATLGVFAVVAVTEKATGNDSIQGLAGLSKRAPFLSWCLAVFVLSLAGIPPLPGFFAKFLLFTSVVASNPGSKLLLWLVVFAIVMSAVSLFYYLRVLKSAYVGEPGEGAAAIRVPLPGQVVVGLLAAVVVLLGCVPGILLNVLLRVIHVSGL